MSRFVTPLAASLLIAGTACGAAAMTKATQALPQDLGVKIPRCEIRIERQGGSIELEGLVFVDKPLSGSYQLTVSQKGAGGSSRINQGGRFSAAPGEAASLGTISLRSTGGFTATLRVQWKGGAVDCHPKPPVQRRVGLGSGEQS